MRLVSDGPDIPPDLIAAQQRGDVLFVCGAGVSFKAGLPGFRSLTERVYAGLGEDWNPHHAEREVMVEGGELAGQYDRAFRCLERRLAAGDLPRAQSMRRRIRDQVRAALQPAPDADLANHVTVLNLSRDSEGSTRLLTTNFDCLFEQAWNTRFGSAIASHAGQAMPRPKGIEFSGVLHLHGRIGNDLLGLEATDLVLTSAEFGDAYLRNGWASRYLYDLARTHSLVLVGYQADDPPMRYLLEALEADRERYPDLKPVYAFVGVGQDDRELQQALWQAKGIHPICYPKGPQNDHAALYATLGAWVHSVDDPRSWRRERLSELLAGDPASVSEEDLGDVVRLLSDLPASEQLADVDPPAGWLPILDKRGAFAEGRACPGPWIVRRIADPAMIRACAAGVNLDGRTWWQIDHALENAPSELSAEQRKAWKLIRRAAQDRSTAFHRGWWELRHQLRSGDADYDLRQAVARAFRPRLRVHEPIEWPTGSPAESRPVTLSRLVRVDFADPTHAPRPQEVLDAWPVQAASEAALLRSLCRALEEALEDAEDAGFLDLFDLVSHVPSIAPHPQNGSRGGFVPMIRLIADLWARLARTSPHEARSVAAAWGASRFTLLRRLHLHALTHTSVFDAMTAASALRALHDEEFWGTALKRETMRMLAERWREFSDSNREALEARIRNGMPRALFSDAVMADAARWQARRDYAIFVRLSRIQAAGGLLAKETLDVLAEITQRHPEWRAGPDDRDDFSSWISSARGHQGRPETLADVPDAALVAEAMRLQQAHPFEQGDLWRTLCRADPQRALRGLIADAVAGPWAPYAWREFIDAACDAGDGVLDGEIAHLVQTLPHAILTEVLASVVAWLRRRWRELPRGENRDASDVLALWDRLAELVYRAEPRDEDLDRSDRMSEAINDPGGMLVELLLDLLNESKPSVGVGLGEQLETRFQLAASAPHHSGLLARSILTERLPSLYRVAPDWVAATLLPRLATEHPESRQLWRARLTGNAPSNPNLFNALKVPFLQLFRPGSTAPPYEQCLASHLLESAFWARSPDGKQISLLPGEVRIALASSTVGVRQQAAWLLWRMVSDEQHGHDGASRWREHVGPFFRDIWPLDAAARDPSVSERLTRMVFECGEAFPDAVDTVVPVLVPFQLWSLPTYAPSDERYGGVLATHPGHVLKLLDAIIDRKRYPPPHDLARLLGACSAADRKLVNTPIYLRLRAIADDPSA